MIVKKFVVAAALAFATASALAGHCPMDMQQIDDALAAKPELTAEQLAEVKKYRAEGESLHKAGKHQESIEALSKAKTVLGI